MFFRIALYTSLAIFALGLLYRVSKWFRHGIGPDAPQISVWIRFGAALKGIAATLFSTRILALLRIFLIDVLLQRFIGKAGTLRWVSHLSIFLGFMLLLLMHAMEKLITLPLFHGYQSTLNPYMFLRNLAALMVLAGVAIALYRRVFSSADQPRSSPMDYYALGILIVIMLSGILLESSKILSDSEYRQMVTDYAGLDEDETEQLQALNAYWVQNFGVVSPDVKGPFEPQLLEKGQEWHAQTCMQCHARPQWAFLSYGSSRLLQAAAPAMERADLPTGLWYVHILACFLGLAYLPFSKFFHIFSTPAFLMSQELLSETSDPANIATARAIELDACAHCGDCAKRCSVAVTMGAIDNPTILPSEKNAALRKLLSGRRLSRKKLIAIQEGSHICTDCRRCTEACPIGIHLDGLCRNLKHHAAEMGYPKPEAWVRQAIGEEAIMRQFGQESLSPAADEQVPAFDPASPDLAATFSACFGCQNCTNVCPVVTAHESPRKSLGLLPHEIMHCLALRQKDLVLDCMMLWDCLTCYLCQEQCPQGVCVTDVLYQLKNTALQQLKEKV